MANGNGGTLSALFKYLIGDVPAQWVRLILFGATVAACVFLARDFRREMLASNEALRHSLDTYVQANQVWQETSKEERARLLRKADARFKRLFDRNGWVYEDLSP